jgi:hypothetical protein
MSTTSKVMYDSWVLRGAKWDRQDYDADWLNSVVAEAVERLHWLFQLLSVIAHSKAKRKRILAWLLLSTRILVMFHLLMWMVTTMALVCRNEANLMFSAENVLGMWGHLVLGDWTFDNHFIDLLVIISSLPLVAKVGIGASSDGENCVLGGEVVGLLRSLMNL